VAFDQAVEVLLVVLGGVGERARERRGARPQQLVELAVGDVRLVEGEDGVAALIRATGDLEASA
jgi:hypothetical protein